MFNRKDKMRLALLTINKMNAIKLEKFSINSPIKEEVYNFIYKDIKYIYIYIEFFKYFRYNIYFNSYI